MLIRHHFTLKHHDHFAQTRALLDKSLQDRDRDVVGKVRDEARLFGREDFVAKICRERIGHDQSEVREAVELFGQERYEFVIELDGDQATCKLDESGGECAGAWADLDDCFVAAWGEGGDDALDDALVFEEVLAEALAHVFCPVG